MAHRPEDQAGRRGSLQVRKPRPAVRALTTLMLIIFLILALKMVSVDARNVAFWSTLAVFMSFAALLSFSFSILHWSAKHAYAVEISAPLAQQDSVATNNRMADELGRFAADLRAELASMSLASPSPVPGTSAPQDFIHEIRAAVSAAQTNWGLMAAALTALIPGRRSPYLVRLAIEPGGNNQPLGKVTVEVFSRIGPDVDVQIIQGGKRCEMVRRAACHVAASILPRTSLSRKPPWTPWYGVKLDSNVFYHFNEARQLSTGGRFDQAIEHFDRAIELDPRNPYIRLEKGATLEQLGLHVDALSIYVDVLTMESWYDFHTWSQYREFLGDKQHFEPRLAQFPSSPNGPAALQLARYRLVCSLASSERLAEQLSPSFSGKKQNRNISGIRDLICKYSNILLDECEPKPELLRKIFGYWEQIEKSPAFLQRVLQYAALREARQLSRDYGWWPIESWKGWRPAESWKYPGAPGRWRYRQRLPISQPALRVLPIWAELQYHHLELHQKGISWSKESLKPLEKYEHIKPEEGWPLDPDLIAKQIRNALTPWHAKLIRWLAPPLLDLGWHEHYNAACTFAVGMLTAPCSDEKSDLVKVGISQHPSRNLHFARRAVNQLSLAIVASGSQVVAGGASWLASGDSDLDELRVTSEYQIFIQRYLPQIVPTPPLPPRHSPELIRSARYLELVEQVARIRQEFWAKVISAEDIAVDATHAVHQEMEWRNRLAIYCRKPHSLDARRQLSEMSAGLPEALAVTMSMVGQDPYWNLLTSSVRSSWAQDSGAHPTEAWLRISRELQECSHELISDRKNRLESLGRLLDQSNYRRIHPHNAGHLVLTWKAIGDYMAKLHNPMPGFEGEVNKAKGLAEGSFDSAREEVEKLLMPPVMLVFRRLARR